MKVGLAIRHLQLVCTESETVIATDIGTLGGRDGLTPARSQQEVAEHPAHSFQRWLDNRAARIAILRARVKSGLYTVDSTIIAESILSTKIHSE